MSNSTIKEIRKYLCQPQMHLDEDVKQIRVTLDNLEKAAASSGMKSQADTLKLLDDLEGQYSQLERQYEELKQVNHELQGRFSISGSELANLGGESTPTALTVGISDLEKRNEEAIFDALSAFDKQCPYCGKDQYRVGIRDKIEIDHFVPISKGGQHVPWNLLPVCKECNRKKKDRQPINFLSASIFQRCQDYLLSVRRKYFDEGIVQYESLSHLKILINNNMEFLRKNATEPFIQDLVQLIAPEKIEDIHKVSEMWIGDDREYLPSNLGVLDYLIDQISNRKGEFAKGVVMSPWGAVCDRLQEAAPKNMGKITPTLLMKVLKKLDWRDLGRINSRDFNSKKRTFRAPELIGMSKSDLRRLGEEQ
jgi:5-methylcytosine-specific restriction endonuclease McrA